MITFQSDKKCQKYADGKYGASYATLFAGTINADVKNDTVSVR